MRVCSWYCMTQSHCHREGGGGGGVSPQYDAATRFALIPADRAGYTYANWSTDCIVEQWFYGGEAQLVRDALHFGNLSMSNNWTSVCSPIKLSD